jgi:cytochrome c553
MIMMVALLVAVPLSLWSGEKEDGASLFKAKCSMCHGEKGEGNPPGVPALKGTKMTAEKLLAFITKGEKGKGFHESPISDLKAGDAKLVADFIKAMK